jgi:3-phenylpropionate/trans-cinnamate dioxygenase ferredoxin reductase component
VESVWRKTSEVAGVELHLGRRATSVDAHRKVVVDDRGVDHTFDKLLLATGGTPRRLSSGSNDVIYFRTLDDYRKLRALAEQRKTFAVIGGGFIGSEIAAALTLQGCKVTLIAPGEGIGARLFPPDLAAFLVTYYREKGVDVRSGQVTHVGRDGSQVVVEAGSGAPVTVDAAVAASASCPTRSSPPRPACWSTTASW